MLNVALPKGRLGNKAYKLFEKIGFNCNEMLDDSRKLVFENKEKGIRYFLVKSSDVPVYVLHGAADVGVVGKDILLESNASVYELLDLDFGKCKICVAAHKDFHDNTNTTLRVATKFLNIASNYYNSINRNIEIIKLNGSIELAPITGLSDVIVDIVETGNTLMENNLKIIHEIIPISARLIANKASFQFKNDIIEKLKKSCEETLNDKNIWLWKLQYIRH